MKKSNYFSSEESLILQSKDFESDLHNNNKHYKGILDENQNFDFNNSTRDSRWNIFVKTLSNITVEPIIFLHIMASLMCTLNFNDLVLDRACRIDLQYNSTICDAIAARNDSDGFYAQEEADAQSVIASIGIWRYALENAIPIFLVLIFGSWSDIYGRKFPMMLPMIGSLFKNAGLILCMFFPSWNVLLVTLFVLIPTSLTGAYPMFSMAYHTFIVDTTSKQHRTLRFGIAHVCQTVGRSLGTVLAGFLISNTGLGFTGLFIVADGLDILAMILTIVIIKNTKGNVKSGYEELESPTIKERVKDIFNLRHLLEAFKTALKPRPGFGRLKLWILLFTLFTATAPFYGEQNVIYLFLRLKFGWGAGEYGTFGMYQALSGGIGVLLSMGLLSWWFSLNDPIVGLAGCLSQISSCFVYAFASTITLIYAAPCIDILNGAMPIAARSMITKSIGASEQGKILSVVGVLDSIIPVIINPAYNLLYNSTLQVFPGAFFLLSACFAIPSIFVFGYLSCRALCCIRKIL